MARPRQKTRGERVRALEAAQDALQVEFQPIRDLWTGETVGEEARPQFADRTPAAWFAEAHRLGRGVEFEIAMIEGALARWDGNSGYVAVDVSAMVVASPAFTAFVHEVPAPDSLVLGLAEHGDAGDDVDLAAAVNALRSVGVRVAVDDVGGMSSFRHMLMLSPEIIKVDCSLFAGIDGHPGREALADLMLQFAERMGAELLATGIERREERDGCAKHGIRYGQGLLLGAPRRLEAGDRERAGGDGPGDDALIRLEEHR